MKDFTATSLIGPNATAAQVVNAHLIGCLYHCWLNLVYVKQDFLGKVWDTISPSVDVSNPDFTLFAMTAATAD